MAKAALILMYHRVAELKSDPWGLCVSPQHFSEQMEVVAKSYSRASLNELLFNMDHDTIAVTFDDGYADNLYNALPILEKFDVPSTFYVVATALGGEDFWWDQLDSLFLQPGLLPEKISFEQDGQIYQWFLQELADYTPHHYERWSSWKAWEKSPEKRQFVYGEIARFLKPLNGQQRTAILDQLWKQLTAGSASRRDHRILTTKELLHFSRSPLVDIGSHTLTHARLASLSLERQKKEIQESKSFLENVLGQPIQNFAYPYGGSDDFTEQTAALVKDSGFSSGCTTIPSGVHPGIDRFSLPRFHVQDWNGDEFEKRLLEWSQL